jgi:hypothetical protein
MDLDQGNRSAVIELLPRVVDHHQDPVVLVWWLRHLRTVVWFIVKELNMINIDVTFPYTGKTRTFRSIRRVAKMLSGNGTASGGLRSNIERKARNALYGTKPTTVRRNSVYG